MDVLRGQGAVMGVLAAGLLVAACGGGGGGGSDSGGGGPGGDGGASGTLTGTVVKGPVASCTVTAFGVANGARGAQLGTAQTDAQGHFTMGVGAYAGPVLLEMHGGTYLDEATGASMPMGTEVMTAAMPGFGAGGTATVQVTPLTSMAHAMAGSMPGGMTDANIGAANGMMGSYFSVGDILHTVPMNPLVDGAGTLATQQMRDYGMTLAAMSQYARSLGMTASSSGIVTVMMRDASDGVMNGMMGSTPISMGGMGGMMGGTMMPAASGTSGLAAALAEFVASGANRSGVSMADMQPLIDKLAGSSGAIR